MPPTFTPTTGAAAAHQHSQQKSFNEQSVIKTQINSNEVDDIVKQMIAIQINSFDLELKQLGNQSKSLLANVIINYVIQRYTTFFSNSPSPSHHLL